MNLDQLKARQGVVAKAIEQGRIALSRLEGSFLELQELIATEENGAMATPANAPLTPEDGSGSDHEV
jgi:hypothetical protein